MDHFADRLLAAIETKGAPVCVGLDPVHERLPQALRCGEGAGAERKAAALGAFCREVLAAVAPHVPCVKVQSACFERYGAEGCAVYEDVIERARAAGLIVIGDVKRGDIGASAEHYAAGLLTGDHAADAVTINSYFGDDGLRPFRDAAAQTGRGAFALVRTSNPGGDAIQSLPLEAGGTVAEAVGRLVAEEGEADRCIGRRGYSLLGAVVGATKRDDAARLRRIMPRQVFLVPGFGAQGGKAEDVAACFHDDGTGAIVTASRSVIYAYQSRPESDWRSAVEAAAIELKQRVNEVLGH